MEDARAQEILMLWEHGSDRSALSRTMALCSAANPEATWEELEHRPLGLCHLDLLRLRRRLFGATMLSYADCEECGAGNDVHVSVDSLMLEAHPRPRTVELGDYELELRPLTYSDVALALQQPVGEQRDWLARRAVVEALRDGNGTDPSELPPEALELVSKACDELDPMASIELVLACAECGHRWSAPLDVADYLWHEVQNHARRQLDEIALLARAFGWTEREVLSLRPARRRAYVERAWSWTS